MASYMFPFPGIGHNMPSIYNVSLGHHDKKEFAKLAKISNYINAITEMISVFTEKKIWPYVHYGKELLEKLNYVLELRLGSDEYTFNNASILIGQSVTCLMNLAYEYVKNGRYYLSGSVTGSPEPSTVTTPAQSSLSARLT